MKNILDLDISVLIFLYILPVYISMLADHYTIKGKEVKTNFGQNLFGILMPVCNIVISLWFLSSMFVYLVENFLDNIYPWRKEDDNQ